MAELGWAALEWPGIEHVLVTGDAAGIRTDSAMILADGELARVAYQLECDAGWRFARVDITVTRAAGMSALSLTRDGDGRWLAGDEPLPALGQCVDIDINRTPLTNTLPVRRLPWSPGQAYDLDVAYISVPELDVRPARQRYTMLWRDDRTGEAAYRYESGSYQADLPVDADGYVKDYPGLWQRL
jgi:hypothetical protein